MLNFFDDVLHTPEEAKVALAIGEFLFAQYTCVTADAIPTWSHTDFLVTVITGKKTWHTVDGIWSANPGETLFFRKGATVFEQHHEPDFCVMVFFIPDDFVRTTVRELAGSLGAMPENAAPLNIVARVENDIALSAFFQSIRAYLFSGEAPAEPMLRLKLKELLLSILMGGKNPTLATYFRKVAESDAPSLPEIMEANYRFNLSLEEYARLCHRSLSTFKRDFRATFQETPGRWLLRKRLDYAAALLRNSSMNVTEAALESGFEDVSHFSRVFKERFKVAPLAYRQSAPGEN